MFQGPVVKFPESWFFLELGLFLIYFFENFLYVVFPGLSALKNNLTYL